MSIEQEIRRHVGPDSTATKPPRSSSSLPARPSVTRASNDDAGGSAAQTGTSVDRGSGPARRDGSSDYQGVQMKAVELRAAVSTLDEEDDPDLQGYLDLTQFNDFRVKLQRNTLIAFETSGADLWEGANRPGIKVDRRFWVTLLIDHQGHYPVFQSGIVWPNMEEPDFTPIDGGFHILTFFVDRIGTGPDAVEQVVCISAQVNSGAVA